MEAEALHIQSKIAFTIHKHLVASVFVPAVRSRAVWRSLVPRRSATPDFRRALSTHDSISRDAGILLLAPWIESTPKFNLSLRDPNTAQDLGNDKT
jgi:hypothetical protein